MFFLFLMFCSVFLKTRSVPHSGRHGGLPLQLNVSTSQPLNFYSILFTPVSSVKPRRRFMSVWKL